MVEIRTFGTLEFGDPARAAELGALLARPKRAALLAYLASARPHGPRRRDELLAVFWPDASLRSARKALNQATYILRCAIGHDAIVSRGGETIELDRATVWSDAFAFEEALARGAAGAALELYRGELLAAVHLSGSPGFERWLDTEREYYRRRATEAAAQLADSAGKAGDYAEASRWLRKAHEWNPYDEAPVVALVRLMIQRGNPRDAAREIESFAGRLRADLGLDISEQLRSLQPRAAGPAADAAAIGDAPRAAGLAASSARKSPGADGRRRQRPVGVRGSAAAAVGVVVGIALLALRLWSSPTLAAPEPRRVHVVPFDNLTGDKALDPLGRIAADWLARGLLRTGLVQVVPINSTERRTAGRRTGAGNLIVAGSYRLDGPRVAIEARIVDAASGAIVRVLGPVDAARDAPLDALDRLRRRTEGALATLIDPRFEDWSDDATQPPTFAAYLEFVTGLERLERGRYDDAVERFRAASEHDSTFTSAEVWTMQTYALSGPPALRDSVARVLEPKRARLPAWERAMLDHNLADMRGDRLAAYEALRDVVRLSATPQWLVLLAGQALSINRAGEAMDLLNQVDPERITGIEPMRYWISLGNALHSLGRYEEELAVARREDAPVPGFRRRAEVRALAGLGRAQEALELIDQQTLEWTWSSNRGEFFRRVALELRGHGHRTAALAVLERSLRLFDAAPDSVHASPVDRRQKGHALYAADRWRESREVYAALYAEGYMPHVMRGDLALSAARLGDGETAEEAIRFYEEWGRENPSGLFWSSQWRARIAAALGDRDRAVTLLREAQANGWVFSPWDHMNPEYEVLRGYAPFDALMDPIR